MKAKHCPYGPSLCRLPKQDQDKDALDEFRATVKRMLETPPKPHKDSINGSVGKTKKGGGHKDRRKMMIEVSN